MPQLHAFIGEKEEPEIVILNISMPSESQAREGLLAFFNKPMSTPLTPIAARYFYYPIFVTRFMHFQVWGRAYRTSYIKKQYALLPHAYVNTSEDLVQTFVLLNSTKAKMSFFDVVGYIYHYGDGSSSEANMSLRVFKTKVRSVCTALDAINAYIDKVAHIKQHELDSLSVIDLHAFWFFCVKMQAMWAAATWKRQLSTLNQSLALRFLQTIPYPYRSWFNTELLGVIRDKAFDNYCTRNPRSWITLISQLLYINNHTKTRSAQFLYYLKPALYYLVDMKNIISWPC